MTTFIILIVLSFLLCLAMFYLMSRNLKVFGFRLSILELCDAYNVKHNTVRNEDSAFNWCLRSISPHKKMVYSFKPLKIENWLTKEMINKLNS